MFGKVLPSSVKLIHHGLCRGASAAGEARLGGVARCPGGQAPLESSTDRPG